MSQFTLYSHKTGPNGWKVAMVLEELGLTYHTIYLDFQTGEHKAPAHTALNPNGRVPTLVDHANNDFVIWESGAILTYLVEKYDPEGKISVKGFEEKMQQLQLVFLLNDCSDFHGLEKDFPALNRWHNALMEREAVRKVYQAQKQLLKA
ncbi:glutathione transferase Ure2p class [Trametes sanguinea]|nr:glutathione transferase Ure2p class [Trametes sanguinea]